MNRDQVMTKMGDLVDAEVRHIEHDPNTRLEISGDEVAFRPGSHAKRIEVAETGLPRVIKFAGLAEDMSKKLTPRTLQTATNELLEEKGRYDLVMHDGKIVDVVTPSRVRHPVKATRVLDLVEAIMPGSEYNRALVIPDQHSVSLEVVGTQEQEVIPGDLVRGGIMVSFSPLGTIKPTVESYINRLVCTNGATSH
ncbi:MAG: hypothetical protein PHQ43_13615, partial [Dehalococcoidales bacterium]|nr:hypothetical protein [Dehalococcoidales bacterium]